MSKPKGIFIINSGSFEKVYGDNELMELVKRVDFVCEPQSADSIKRKMGFLGKVEVIFSGLGAPLLDHSFLNSCPNLRTFYYGASSIENFVTDAFWDKDISITTSASLDAIPVSEFVLGQVILALKHSFYLSRNARATASFLPKDQVFGAYKTNVGLVGFDASAKRVLDLIKKVLDVNVLVHDPDLTEEDGKKLGFQVVSLEDLFLQSHTVSCHIQNDTKMELKIQKEHFESMPQYATFINTSSGSSIEEDSMIEVLRWRRDLTACLDITNPSPPVKNSALFALPNVVLTPNLSGSVNRECNRIGRFMIDELDRSLKGEPLMGEIKKEPTEKLG